MFGQPISERTKKIVYDRNRGMTHKELSSKYKLSVNTINLILKEYNQDMFVTDILSGKIKASPENFQTCKLFELLKFHTRSINLLYSNNFLARCKKNNETYIETLIRVYDNTSDIARISQLGTKTYNHICKCIEEYKSEQNNNKKVI